MSETVHDIWPIDSGIRDYGVDPATLAIPETARIRSEWARQRAEIAESDVTPFAERLYREWAIETGIVENLYHLDRGVTETLIEQGFHAALIPHGSANRDPDLIVAFLNDQREALDSLFDFVAGRRTLTVGYVKELHAIITASQGTVENVTATGDMIESELLRGEWKRLPNHVSRDGVQHRYCPPEQTASEMERLVNLHQEHEDVPPEVEAAWLHHRFTQIHPFQDGNGRVARALSSLVLIRAGLFPFSVPRDEKSIYIESLEIADRGDLSPLTRFIARHQEIAYAFMTEKLRKA